MSYNPVQKSVGFGPPGRFYDYSIIIESQQACGNKIEIEIIIDDRLRSEFIAYSIGNSTQKTVRLTDYDRDRALKYAILSLPSSAREVTIECLDSKGPIQEQCCTYDLYRCTFTASSARNGKALKEGKRKEGGASLTYAANGYQDAYQKKKSNEAAQDKGFFAKFVTFTVNLTFLVVRCYLGAVIARNLGYRSLEHLIGGAVVAGIISEHTLGNTFKVLFSSSLLKIGLLFSPVCLGAYFAVKPHLFQEVLQMGVDGILNHCLSFFSNLKWLNGNIKPATLWATAGLMLLGVILSLVIPDKPEPSDESEYPA